MPRYFFHVRDGHDIPDKEGIELADLQTAKTEATRRAGALLSQCAAEFWNGHEWSINVASADSIVLCTLHLVAIVGSPLRSDADRAYAGRPSSS